MSDKKEPEFSQHLCAKIMQYWLDRGVEVEMRIEPVICRPRVDQKGFTVFVIKSYGIPLRGW